VKQSFTCNEEASHALFISLMSFTLWLVLNDKSLKQNYEDLNEKSNDHFTGELVVLNHIRKGGCIRLQLVKEEEYIKGDNHLCAGNVRVHIFAWFQVVF
jgi:hypothetical protein